jgi:dihydropteroate synthase
VQGLLCTQGAPADLERNLVRAAELVADGADIVEIVGAADVARVSPLVEALATRFDVPLSVRTARAEVLAAACVAGAVAGNDGSGFGDPDYLPTAARCGAAVGR